MPAPSHRAWPLTLALALGLATSPLLAGCAAVTALAQGTLARPTLTFVRAEVQSLDFDGATLALEYRLDNPNLFGLELSRVSSWLQVDGRVVTRGEVKGGLRLAPAGATPVTFTARLPFAEVPHLLALAQRGGAVDYRVGAEVVVDSPLGPLTLPVSHAGTAPVPALPTFRLAGVAVALHSLTELALTVRVAVANPNPFPLPDGAFAFGVSVAGEVVASGEEGLEPVPADGRGHLDLQVSLSILSLGRTAAALRAGAADVRVVGEARLGALRLPLDVAGRARAP